MSSLDPVLRGEWSAAPISDDERAALARCDEAWGALKVWLHGRECFALSSDVERVAAAERAWDALGDLLWPEVAP